MSARKPRLVLTPLARKDLRDTLRYTTQTWGPEQRDRYKSLVLRRLRELIDYPELGRAREDIFPGCRSLLVEQHVAYYHVTESQIIVDRLLHARQDATGAVAQPPQGEPPS